MAKDNQKVPASPVERNAQPPATQEQVKTPSPKIDNGTFPRSDADKERLLNYQYYERLLMGEHFEAFNIRINNDDFSKAYKKLRYIKANFAGLVSKVIADLLFSEPINIKAEKNQDFINAFVFENNLNAQFYESAITNSALGDDVFKLRVGPRHPDIPDNESTIILEEVSPSLYFPTFYDMNTKADPKSKELSYVFKIGDKKYLKREIHTIGLIENKVYLMEGDKIKEEVSLADVGMGEVEPLYETGIDRSLVIHIPNWKVAHKPMGISDYFDLDSLFFAINNRMTMIDNILDKHSDPILMVPDGIIDEKGNVNKKRLGVIEVQEGSDAKPEYIVWDASLENAFKEVEKLTEMLFMISETSPDILGMGQGQAESGRALKLKLLRTIAKAKRKRIYYDQGIKEMLYTAQLLAREHNLKINGVGLAGEPEIPELEWMDGIPNDDMEAAQVEEIRINSGTTTTKDALIRLDGIDEDTAEEKAKEIEDKNKIEVPTMNLGNMQENTEDEKNKEPVK